MTAFIVRNGWRVKRSSEIERNREKKSAALPQYRLNLNIELIG
jgi:hypothetical protein